MASMEVNKVIAAVLVSGITFFVTGLIGDNLVHVTKLKEPAIKIDVPEAGAPSGQPAPAELPPLAVLMAKADPAAGEAYSKKVCSACHTFTEGGKSGVGPNLYGVVGAVHGHMAGFNYSEALKGKSGPWNFDSLNAWLAKPSAYAPGTRMAFAGINNAQDRANVVDYLRTLSPSPQPRPTPAEPAAAAPAGAAAAPGAPAAGQGGDPPIATLLASADATRGEADTKKLGCVVCHTFTEGGKAGLGPNLYGIVGAPHGHMEGFAYSNALKGKQGPWTYDGLNEWLKKPSAYAPGTKMTFAGASNPKERADIIEYLRSLAAAPQPRPGAAP